MEKDNKNPQKEQIIPNVIYSYTQDQAIEDGVLILIGYAGSERVIFTRTLLEKGYSEKTKRKALVDLGFALLRKPDPEDSPGMRLRVIEKGKIWVIWNGDGFTFLTPEDY